MVAAIFPKKKISSEQFLTDENGPIRNRLAFRSTAGIIFKKWSDFCVAFYCLVPLLRVDMVLRPM
jgi:hypothetical protein